MPGHSADSLRLPTHDNSNTVSHSAATLPTTYTIVSGDASAWLCIAAAALSTLTATAVVSAYAAAWLSIAVAALRTHTDVSGDASARLSITAAALSTLTATVVVPGDAGTRLSIAVAALSAITAAIVVPDYAGAWLSHAAESLPNADGDTPLPDATKLVPDAHGSAALCDADLSIVARTLHIGSELPQRIRVSFRTGLWRYSWWPW